MAAGNFPACLAHVLKHEGGWADHPNDPGGATMKGVIQRVYDGYRDRAGKGRRSVRHIEDGELHEIYERQYWHAIRGDDLPPGVDLATFDQAVNSGPVQSGRWLQRALGVTADGHIGEGTLDACLQCGDLAAVVNSMCDQRLAFMKGLRNRKTGKALWPDFGVGWSRRVADVRANSIAMTRAALPLPEPEPDGPPQEYNPVPVPLPRPDEPGAPKAPPNAPPAPSESWTIKGLAMQILSALGAGAAYMLSDWRIMAALVVLIIFLAIFIGRDYLRRILEDHV